VHGRFSWKIRLKNTIVQPCASLDSSHRPPLDGCIAIRLVGVWVSGCELLLHRAAICRIRVSALAARMCVAFARERPCRESSPPGNLYGSGMCMHQRASREQGSAQVLGMDGRVGVALARWKVSLSLSLSLFLARSLSRACTNTHTHTGQGCCRSTGLNRSLQLQHLVTHCNTLQLQATLTFNCFSHITHTNASHHT